MEFPPCDIVVGRELWTCEGMSLGEWLPASALEDEFDGGSGLVAIVSIVFTVHGDEDVP